MEKKVKLNKEVFDKRTYKKTINTDFTQLGISSIESQLDIQPTTQEFFKMYNDLFYQINELGPTNSHEYLVKTSGEYIAFEAKDELIEALQKEISDLRNELLKTQQDLATALTEEEVEELPEEIELPPDPVLDVIQAKPTPEPPEEPDTSNPLAIAFFKTISKPNGSRDAWDAVPITMYQLKKNIEKMKQNNTLPYPDKYGDTLKKLNKMDPYLRVPAGGSAGVTTYNFTYWGEWRTSAKDATNKGDKRDNIYETISKTAEQVLKHFRKEKNFKESGGLIP